MLSGPKAAPVDSHPWSILPHSWLAFLAVQGLARPKTRLGKNGKWTHRHLLVTCSPCPLLRSCRLWCQKKLHMQ